MYLKATLFRSCHLTATQATPEGAKQGARFGVGMLGWGKTINAGTVVTGKCGAPLFDVLANDTSDRFPLGIPW
jgi:hypothetical protein